MNGETFDNSVVAFERSADRPGIVVDDRVCGRRRTVLTADTPNLQRALTDWFHFPVDAAVSFETDVLRFPRDVNVAVRDGTGEHLAELTEEPQLFARGDYYFDVATPTKLYVYVEDASFEGYFPDRREYESRPVAEFGEETRVVLGARSHHDRPQATITVPDGPEALMEALPYLGSSIKEWSCERSWPTLRGHPPAIERGDELDVPAELSKPDTGVTIAVPPTYADLYRVAPLVYYLGADVVPGSEAELRLDVGHTEPLQREGQTLEASVDRLLTRCLLLDSLVRVGGYYDYQRYEYEELAPHLPFYPPELYDASIPEQLIEYLEVSFDALEPYVPEWSMTATLRPTVDDTSLLVPVLHRLGRVHVADGTSQDRSSDDHPAVVEGYTSDPIPANALYLSTAGFEHGRGHTPRDAGDERIRFATDGTSARRAFDAVVPEVVHEGEDSDVTTVERPTRAALRRHLAADVDFLHVGRATDCGFVCADGTLPLDEIDDVGATTVTATGRAAADAVATLVESGAVAGVAAETADPADIGRLAGYLVAGHTVPTATDVAGIDAPRFAGDVTRLQFNRLEVVSRGVVDVTAVDGGEYRATVTNEPTLTRPLGSVCRLNRTFAREGCWLVGARVDQPVRLSRAQLVELLDDPAVTVRLDGHVYHDEEDPETFVRRVTRRPLDTGVR